MSRDPEFVKKVNDVVGLYLNPPANAIVLSVDEKTSIQALERTQLPLPLRQGRAVRHTQDYKRNGVVDLYAALELATGQVTHALTNSHTAADFLSFMKKVGRAYWGAELHVTLDNSSSHGKREVKAWPAGHPNGTFTTLQPARRGSQITKMKDGRKHLAHKHAIAVDLETGAVVGTTLSGGAAGDTDTISATVADAVDN